jgi:heterodisulfide reductase subunit A-like polyferredoxin
MPRVRANSPPPPAAGPGAVTQAARNARAIGRRNVIEERLGIDSRRLAADIRASNAHRSDPTAVRLKQRALRRPLEERVLIIGGGFAGIAAARRLKVEIVKTGSDTLSSRCSQRRVRRRMTP